MIEKKEGSQAHLYTKDELLRELRLQNNQLGAYQSEGMVPVAEDERTGFRMRAVGSYKNYYSPETVAALKVAEELRRKDDISVRLMVGLACAPTLPLRYLIPEPFNPISRARMGKKYGFYPNPDLAQPELDCDPTPQSEVSENSGGSNS
jgi:hypothetical protein